MRATRLSVGVLCWAGLLGPAGCAGCAPTPREPVVAPPETPLFATCATAADPDVTVSEGGVDDVAAAFVVAQPGDTIRLADLDVQGPLEALPSGTADAPIVIDARGSTFHGTWSLADVHDLVIVGGLFLSDGTYPWLQGHSARRVRFSGNAFDIDCLFCGDQFVGVDLPLADHVVFCGNRIGWWWGDTFSFVPAGAVMFEGNDFSRAAADHSVITYVGEALVVRHNLFMNPYDRVIHVASQEPDVLSTRALIEHNVFINSDWDRERDRPGAENDIANDGGGAAEVVRLIGDAHIFRNNILLGNNRGNDTACHAALHMSTWSHEPYHNEHNRQTKIYGNTFLDNQRSAIGISDGLDSDGNEDIAVAHNVFANNERAAVATCSDVRSPDDVRMFGNLLDGDRVALAGRPVEDISGLQAAEPEWFFDNQTGPLPFRDPAAAAAVRADEPAGLVFEDMPGLFSSLAVEASTPAASRVPLTTATGSTWLVLDVEDARWFSDGHGLTPGDLVRVGEELAQVEGVNPEAGQLVLDHHVDVVPGAPVVLEAMRVPGVSAPW